MGNLQENELLKKIIGNCKKDGFKSLFGSETFVEYIEENAIEAARKREDYKEKNKKVTDIMNQYPKLRAFIEDEKIEELSKKELEKLREIAIIQIEIAEIESEEIFKLGIKNGAVL